MQNSPSRVKKMMKGDINPEPQNWQQNVRKNASRESTVQSYSRPMKEEQNVRKAFKSVNNVPRNNFVNQTLDHELQDIPHPGMINISTTNNNTIENTNTQSSVTRTPMQHKESNNFFNHDPNGTSTGADSNYYTSNGGMRSPSESASMKSNYHQYQASSPQYREHPREKHRSGK